MDFLVKVYQKYGASLACSYNGGKESDIILYLAMKVFPNMLLYTVEHKDDFPEITRHVNDQVNAYGTKILRYKDMKEAISDLTSYHGIKAILCGFRSTDPNAPKEKYQKTDNTWPNVVMVSPLLNWSYKDVWNYILLNEISVCDLYSKGYTSIGVKTNTSPNYYLFDGIKYEHASKLDDGSKERVCRMKNHLPVEVKGIVVKGKGIAGSKLGFPTANLSMVHDPVEEGIYMGLVYKDDKIYKAVICYGSNFHHGKNNPIFEVHIIDMPWKDLYGQKLAVTVKKYIRPILKLECLDDVKDAIKKDIKICRLIK